MFDHSKTDANHLLLGIPVWGGVYMWSSHSLPRSLMVVVYIFIPGVCVVKQQIFVAVLVKATSIP